ncbi:hypothetical protein GCM10027447_01770 [Glycomyces halotolerans]
MFNEGITALLRALPQLDGLDNDQVRRMLSRAWFEAEGRRRLGSELRDHAPAVEELRRLATALEAHLILVPGLDSVTVRASAFVAAEALDIATELEPPAALPGLFGDGARYERIETAVLYLIAGYDANAALTAQQTTWEPQPGTEPPPTSEAWLLEVVRSYLTLGALPVAAAPAPVDRTQALRERARGALMRQLGDAVAEHLRWLAFQGTDRDRPRDAIESIVELLERSDAAFGAAAVPHADLHHLAVLLLAAIGGTTDRALRTVPPPAGDGGRFQDYQRDRARTRPLLWPAAAEYAQRCLPGPRAHAVVTVPTGAGKSAVADLAIAQALHRGWALYLAPTNALTGQIRRQLTEAFGHQPSTKVREFAGGMEYSPLEAGALETIEDRQILVMTPEKCTLLLRQNPNAFAHLQLCVADEAHLLGQRDSRALVAELVIAEILHRAPQVRMLLLSALIANPDDLARWFSSTTGIDAIVVNDPWRPTRTLRTLAGIETTAMDQARTEGKENLQELGPDRVNTTVQLTLTLLGGLQGTWKGRGRDDFARIKTHMTTTLTYHRENQLVIKGYVNQTVGDIAHSLAENDHRVLAFLPRSKHYPFAVGTKVAQRRHTASELRPDIQALLTLAAAELGGPSALQILLERGVGVHTSAMLPEERRASEIAFEHGSASIMFATGTMAQGLNLPATAVVLGGTTVGSGQDDGDPSGQVRRRGELLNAIGRTGRASVAARSMAILVPDHLLQIPSHLHAGAVAGTRPPIFDDEEASLIVESHLGGLIAKALDGTLNVQTLPADEQTALTILSHQPQGEPQGAVLHRTWAAAQPALGPYLVRAAQSLDAAGTAYLVERGSPAWVAAAAHRSGMSLPTATAVHAALDHELRERPAPQSLLDWSDLMIQVLSRIDRHSLHLALPPDPLKSTLLAGVHAESDKTRAAAWQALHAGLRTWLAGAPLLAIAEHTEHKDPRGNLKRTSQSPLPKTWKLVDTGFKHWIAMAAGGIGAIVTEGKAADPDGPWQLGAVSERLLSLLPLAVRYGAATPSTVAWMRAGARPRVVAHLLNDLIPAPEDLDDEGLQQWAWRELRALRDGHAVQCRTEAEQEIIAALRQVL